MAFLSDKVWYYNAGDMSTTGYFALAQWQASHAYSAGALVRQTTANVTVGNERAFICTVAGTSGGSEPTTNWASNTSRGQKITDNTVTWVECTGQPLLNGDTASAIVWLTVKNTAVSVGQFIYDATSGSVQVCTTAGTAGNGSSPSFSATAGTTTADNTVTWTSCGLASSFTKGQCPMGRFSNIGATNYMLASIQTTVYVGDNSHETRTGSNTLINNTNSTFTTPLNIFCHDHTGSYPPSFPTDLRTTASLDHSGSSTGMSFTNTNSFYVYGMTFKQGQVINILASGSNAGSFQYHRFEKCTFINGATAGSSFWEYYTGGGTAFVELIDCQWAVSGGASANAMLQPGGCDLTWRNPSGAPFVTGTTGASGATGSALFRSIGIGDMHGRVLFDGLDMSKINYIFSSSSSLSGFGIHAIFKDCKMMSGYQLGDAFPSGSGGGMLDLIRCDSGAGNYQFTRRMNGATLTTETSITRVGGATIEGQLLSWKIVNTANNQWLLPFECPRVSVPNATVNANVTVTVYGTVNAGAVPNNDEVWIEVMAMTDSGDPLGTTLTSGKATFWDTGSANTSDGSSWNGGGSGVGWSPFKMSVTFSSPQIKLAGQLFAIVKTAKTSGTFYIDPRPVLS